MHYFLSVMTAMAVAMMGLAFSASQAFGQEGIGCFLAHPDADTLQRECIELRDDKAFDLVESSVQGTLADDRVSVQCIGNYASTVYPDSGIEAPPWTVLRAKYVKVNKSNFVRDDGGVLTMADSSIIHLSDEVTDDEGRLVNCGLTN